MEKFQNIKKTIFDVYYGIGIVVLAFMSASVMFAVIMRYFFHVNFDWLAEFNVTLFAFTTFWGMGVCVIKEEHVMIDIIYDRLDPKLKRILSIVNYSILLLVVIFFTVYAFQYVAMAGKQLSMGMEIPMYYMYGIMPVTGIITIICTIIKIIEFVNYPIEHFESKNKVLTKEEGDK